MIPLIAHWAIAVASLLIGTAAIYMALLPPFPVSWLYHHARWRKPAVWALLAVSSSDIAFRIFRNEVVPLSSVPPLVLTVLGVVLAYRMHQEVAFPAVDFPATTDDPLELPLRDDMQLAVIELDGVTRAYPLDFVIHHHVVNDRFGNRLASLTYCAMCRSIIPFDVTDVGPLFVGSFKHANMIVADRRTRTFFQQATFESLIGPLHPRSLTMIPFQLFSWADVKRMLPSVQVAHVTERDLRAFELPIPGIWRKIVAGEATPGLPAAQRDQTFPARTHVIGVIDPRAKPPVAYLKEEVVVRGIVENDTLDLVLVAADGAVNGFSREVEGRTIALTLTTERTLLDRKTGSIWDLRGRNVGGPLREDLRPVALSDEYWFSWKRFHPDTVVVRVSDAISPPAVSSRSDAFRGTVGGP